MGGVLRNGEAEPPSVQSLRVHEWAETRLSGVEVMGWGSLPPRLGGLWMETTFVKEWSMEFISLHPKPGPLGHIRGQRLYTGRGREF